METLTASGMPYERHTYHGVVRRLLKRLNPRLGAEVGVYRGQLSERLLDAFHRLTLVLVDTWAVPPRESSYARSRDQLALQHTATDWAAVEREALARTAPYAPRAVVMRCDLVLAAGWVEGMLGRERRLDFAFLDADHSEQGTRAAIDAWWPLVREGGMLLGHDYNCPGYPGVRRAVDRWAVEVGLAVRANKGRVWSVGKPK